MKLIIILLIVVLISGCDTQTAEEKNKICLDDCLSEGWQDGNWGGWNFCFCHNGSIVIDGG